MILDRVRRLILLVVWLLGALMATEWSQETLIEHREQGGRLLLARAGRLAFEETPERGLLHLVHGWARGGQVALQQHLQAMEKWYPGALKIAVWDSRGHYLPLAGPVLSGRRMWEKLAQRFFLPPSPPVIDETQLNTDPDLKSLRSLLGKRAPVQDIVRLRNEAIPITWLEQPCLVFPYAPAELRLPARPGTPVSVLLPALGAKNALNGSPHVSPNASPSGLQKTAPVGSLAAEIGGALVLVFPQHLPHSFWRDLMLRLGSLDNRDGTTPAVMMSLRRPRSSYSQPGAPRGRAFFDDLRRAYRTHDEAVFPCGDYLITEVAAPENQIKRVFLTFCLTPARQAAQRQFWGLMILLSALLGLGELLIARSGLAPAVGFSFRLRIALLFLAALLIPVSAFFLLGRPTVAAEQQKLQQLEMTRLKATASELQTLFARYFIDVGNDLVRELEKIMAAEPTRDQAVARYEELVKTKHIAGFYLTTLDGTLEHVYDPGEGPGGNPGLKTMVQEAFGGLKMLVATMKPNLTRSRLVAAHTFQRMHLRNSRLYLYPVALVLDRQLLILTMEVTNEMMEKAFATTLVRERHRQQNWAGSLLHDGRVEFVSPHETIPQPAVVFAGIRDSGRLAEARAGAMQGEISLAGQRHAFVLAPSDELTWFRPLLAVSLEPGFGVVRQRWRRLIVTGVAAMVPVIFLGLILSAGLLGPMAELEKAVQRIRRGELKQRLPVFGTNELSVLNHCWNEMAASLEERERMRSFVSGAVLRAVREETMTTSRRGQLCEATILFTHIKDFAPLSAGMAPAQLFSLLNEFLAGAERCIRAFDGEVDKFIGDAVMAVFTHKGHERAAVRAAAAITDFVRQYNLAASAGGKPAIRIGIGINTGNVMMGDVGSSRRKELTVIGDAVNLAARLESVSESGRSTRIMISGETFDRLESEIHARLLPLAQVKGKQETVRIFEFEGPRNGGTI